MVMMTDMTTALRKLVLVLVLLGIGGTLAACDNTIRGASEDVRDTSDAITDQVE